MSAIINPEQLQRAKSDKGFIAALDQSGGSTPKALKLYGIEETEYSGDPEMFDLIHAMRSRIIQSPVFTSERILGAILFEMTMNRKIDGKGTAEFLWQNKQILPFLKVDNGLADETNGAQIMKPIPELSTRLESAKSHGVFGTKMRSVIKLANQTGVADVVRQQFEIGKQIISAGLVPIIEPEVDINSPEKSAAEIILKTEIISQLNALNNDQNVMLKLTLPNETGFYAELVKHPRVVRVVALSGGYSREEANKKLAQNLGVIASFSRALTEGLSAKQSETQFNGTLDTTIQAIYQASNT
jgi:fructose-bisphosphate aldolase class I